jgi:hypothetical protein
VTILDALRDPALFGALPAFRDLTTWRRWCVFLAAVYGLALSSLRAVGLSEAEALRIFCEHTGRSHYAPPAGGYREAVCIVGRQSGKTRIAATLAAFAAATAQPQEDGTEKYIPLVAQDARAALRTLFSYACAPFEYVPVLARGVRDRRADALVLDGCTMPVYPCRPAALRGIGVPDDGVAVCDELGHYRSSEGFPTDSEMLRAIRPCLAMSARGKLIVLSSPYAANGALYDLHRRHFGRDDSDVLVWVGAAHVMNPTLPADYLRRMERDDPEAYRSEVLAEFRAGVSTFFDPEALAACVAGDVIERGPVAGCDYVAHFDPSGGRHDAAALAVAHAEGERMVLDVLRVWPSPHNPTGVATEAGDVVRAYGISEVQGDRYAGEFPAEAFRACGIEYVPSERDTSATFLAVLPLVNSDRVVLLDQPDLLRELRSLERRRGASGRDRVSHPPGGHDDRAAAAAGALVRAASEASEPPLMLIGGSAWREWQARHGEAPTVEPPTSEAVADNEPPADSRLTGDGLAARLRELKDRATSAMTWRFNAPGARRREHQQQASPREPGLMSVAKAVITGDEQAAARTAAEWAARQRDQLERDEEKERYDAATRWLRERVARSPGGCYMPGIDD